MVVDFGHVSFTLFSKLNCFITLCVLLYPSLIFVFSEIQPKFPVKVKVEKLDLKLAWIKTKLDVLLQCLPEKSYMGGEHLDEEAWKTQLDACSKDCSIIVAPGKGHPPIFCHSKWGRRGKWMGCRKSVSMWSSCLARECI